MKTTALITRPPYQYQMPVHSLIKRLLQENGVDTDSYIFLRYSGDRTALLSTSFVKDMQSEGIIYGTNGSMKVRWLRMCNK